MRDNPIRHPTNHDDQPRGFDPDDWLLRDAHMDDRLRHVVYVDGRFVDSWTTSVAGTRWEDLARSFYDERRPPRPVLPAIPPRPAHERVLDWLDGLVGGRAAVLALTDDPVPPPAAPTFEDAEAGAACEATAEHLDRVCGAFFDEEVAGVLDWALHLLWDRRPTVLASTLAHQTPNATAGGLVWVVGKANGLFVAGVRQQSVQRELWMRQTLSAAGQRVAPALRGVALSSGHRPLGAPDVVGFAEPRLLTPTTRRQLIEWRDQALAAVPAGPTVDPT